MPRVMLGRETRNCETCGSPVNRKVSEFRDHVFCTHLCYTSSEYYRSRLAVRNAKRYADSRRQVPCMHCGKTVDRPVSQFHKNTYCSRECSRARRIADPTRQKTSSGYVRIFVGRGAAGADSSGHILEHRHVMQRALSRPLLAEENVHHINGVRDDNRPENLELWSRSQPSGQRVEDKIRWAKDFLALYEGVTPM